MTGAPKRRYAVIDIGSNAVRLQIGTLVRQQVISEVFTRIPLGLGGGSFAGRQRRIAAPERRRLSQTLTGMHYLIAGMKPCRYRAVATAALRAAVNRQQVIDEVYRHCGMRIRLLDGHEEATAIGMYVAAQFPAAAVLNADIGGGSTDCAAFTGGCLSAVATFALGTARARGGSAAEKNRCRQWMLQHCAPGTVVTSSGGSAMQLQACCGEITEKHLLRWQKEVRALSAPELSARYQMSPDRAAHAKAAIDIYLLILKAGPRQILPVRGGLSEALIWQQLGG